MGWRGPACCRELLLLLRCASRLLLQRWDVQAALHALQRGWRRREQAASVPLPLPCLQTRAAWAA